MISALLQCHENDICHRDIKPENMMLKEDGSAVLADFGVSVQMDNCELLKGTVGSLRYFSPEIVRTGK
jgi:serine/threonine protein kinase